MNSGCSVGKRRQCLLHTRPPARPDGKGRPPRFAVEQHYAYTFPPLHAGSGFNVAGAPAGRRECPGLRLVRQDLTVFNLYDRCWVAIKRGPAFYIRWQACEVMLHPKSPSVSLRQPSESGPIRLYPVQVIADLSSVRVAARVVGFANRLFN